MPIPQIPSPLALIIATDTYDSNWFSGQTIEAQIQNAITAAAADGAARVLVHKPYDASLVTFNANVQMVREGGDWSVYDAQAYGVVPTSTSGLQASAQSAVITAVATQPFTLANGDTQEFNITSNIAVVIQAPANTPAPSWRSQELTITFFNNSGGALGTAPTFATGAGAFLTSAAVVNPGNGLGVSYVFRWSQQANRYREVSRTVAF